MQSNENKEMTENEQQLPVRVALNQRQQALAASTDLSWLLGVSIRVIGDSHCGEQGNQSSKPCFAKLISRTGTLAQPNEEDPEERQEQV